MHTAVSGRSVRSNDWVANPTRSSKWFASFFGFSKRAQFVIHSVFVVQIVMLLDASAIVRSPNETVTG